MPKEPKNSSKTKTQVKGRKQSFEDSVLREAKKIAAKYRVTFDRDGRLGFIGSSFELPTAFADGKTVAKCYKATQEALTAAVAAMIESGQILPQPLSERNRTCQVNIRLTAEEKQLLRKAAVESKSDGISDFIRNSLLHHILSKP